MTEEERARLEKARKTNRKRILIAAAVIAVAVIVTLLIYEFGSRNPIKPEHNSTPMTTDSMDKAAVVFGEMHFYPDSDLVTKITLQDFPTVDYDSMEVVQSGKWENYYPEADRLIIECSNGVILTIVKSVKRTDKFGEEFFEERFPEGYTYNEMIAYSDFEIRSGYPFLFACEPSEEGDEYIYTYGFEVNDMTEEEGKAAITEVLESLRSYE